MKRRILAAIAAIAAVTVLFTGCNDIKDAVSGAVAQVISGNVTGEVSKTYATKWFEFTIDAIEVVPSYAGYTASPGHKLIDVLITEKGTFEEPSPMGTFDFFIGHGDIDNGYWPLDPIDETMMPDEFYLATDEVVQYHMVYEVPDTETGLQLSYVEFDEAGTEGNTFTINIAD